MDTVAAQVVDGEGCGPAPLRTHDFMGVPCLRRTQVAELLGVVPRTINYLEKQGKIKVLRNVVTVWGHYPLEETLEFARTYKPGRGGARKADYWTRDAAQAV